MNIIYKDETQTLYMKNGLYHRQDGPAVIKSNLQEWLIDGKYYREDGPARLFRDTLLAEYWIDYQFYTSAHLPEEMFNKYWRF